MGEELRKTGEGAPDDAFSDWVESLDEFLEAEGRKPTHELLAVLLDHAERRGVRLPYRANTPYLNSIPKTEQPAYPGDLELERRIRSLIRWNAMAMVVRANRESAGIGGHISTYASCATMWEVAFHHFFQGRDGDRPPDQIYFQGHASPGVYARALLEGRLTVDQVLNFRRELAEGGGLSSYPHPWLMPDFWEFPTVSMGLSAISAIYQARFNRYLEHRGILKKTGRVWAFLGDGETDEPESLGAITLASREHLDNLIFVVNCNLQRLDGPVRGNGKIIQELEAIFRGAGWNVIKVVWGRQWDELLARDTKGLLVRRMEEACDGDYQKYSVEPGSYAREHFFGTDPELKKLVEHLSDGEIHRLMRGGHDPTKVYAAYHWATTQANGRPTVILAKTIKGYGLGEAGEGRNITHQQKKLNEEELREFRSRFGIPISDQKLAELPIYVPPEETKEIVYLRKRREALGGFVPRRSLRKPEVKAPKLADHPDLVESSGTRVVATTMSYVRILTKLLKDPEIGKRIVPIIPDEARTFGMEGLFRTYGIYASQGQRYEPVDRDSFLYYKEAKDGQILEEGITEAGAMCSFIAAGTAYATHGVDTIPFFAFYSMFGFQRIGDLIWAAADNRCKGFLIGATAGRTTLAGEGLQHQDGHSHILASTVPTLRAYDPAFEYELAVIVFDGIRRMYEAGEEGFYYLTVQNEKYEMPAMPEGAEQGILEGMYRLSRRSEGASGPAVQLLGSGSILMQALRAQQILDEKYGVAADVWSVTSYKELRREALEAERWNRLHPGEPPRETRVARLLKDAPGPVIAATDYMKAVPDMIAPWVPGGLTSLGTDGFGRSESRESLRRFFEVDAESIAYAALARLAQRGEFGVSRVLQAAAELGIEADAPDPVTL
jgi:pyruvate dehydrogenase E1 component